MKLIAALAFAFAFSLPPLIGAQSGSVYLVQKEELYLQTSASAPAAFPLYPFEMSLQAPAATNVVGPAGTVVLTANGGNGSPGLQSNYATQAALDAAYPNGTYSFSGPPAYAVSLTGNLYPTVTPAWLSGGTWSNGVLVIDPAVATTLTFSTFTGYANTGAVGHIAFQASAQDGSNTGIGQTVVVSSALLNFPVSATPLTSVAVPTGTFSPGVVYQASLNFDTAGFVDTTSLSGGALVGLYSKVLAFYIVGKPASSGTPISVNALSNVVGVSGSVVTIPLSGTGLTGTGVVANWFFNGGEMNLGGTGSHYSIQNGVNLVINGAGASDVGRYFAIVAGPGGLAVTNEVALTLTAPTAPQITTQPASVTAIGGTVVFNVTATGGGLSYQWKFNGANVPGNSTTSRLILTNINSGSAGGYTCVVSNGAGAVTSAAAMLTVPSQSANLNGRLVNESVSSSVAAGTTLTVGFLVGGSGTSQTQTLPVLVRGIGPALAGFGLQGTMPDPAIQVIPLGSQTALYSNDNWGSNSAAVIAAENATGAFGLPTGSLDAALTAGLTAGGYSVALTPNGPGGTALAEIYDNIPAGTYQVTAPRIVNLSALTILPAGGTLSAGFVLGGSTSRTVLIRAIGPTLAGLGITGLMADPKLTLVTSNGTFVVGNQGWGGDPVLASIAVQAGGFAFASPSSLDSAVLVTLQPGTLYTAEATSASGGGGEVLIEIYEVP